MARLAIIIPYLGNVPSLEDTLASVLANRPKDCEVLVVLSHPYDDPYEVGDEVRFITMGSRAGFAESANVGIGLTRAPVVYLLACGAEVSDPWADAALRHFDDPRVAAVVPLVVDREHPDQVVAAGMSYHAGGEVRPLALGRSATAVPPQARTVLASHPAAAFYRRSLLDCVGRLNPCLGDRLASTDLGLTFRQLGFRTVLEPQSRVAVRPESLRAGWFRGAMEKEEMFWRWAPMHGWMRSLALHGVLLTAEGARSLLNLAIVARAAGRVMGVCRALSHRGHRRQILELQARVSAEERIAATAAGRNGGPSANRYAPRDRNPQRLRAAG